MGTFSYTHTLVAGQPENVNHVQTNFDDLKTLVNGNLDSANLAAGAVDVAELAATLAAYVGVSQSGSARRGKSIIATEESRTNTAYGNLTTPDRVSSIVLPTDGLLAVAFSGEFKSSVSGAGRAAIFIGATQLKDRAGAVQEASTIGTAYVDLGTLPAGLTTIGSVPSEVSTGQVVGSSGICWVRAAAGTYNVELAFKATSGSVTAKNRKLWAWTVGF